MVWRTVPNQPVDVHRPMQHLLQPPLPLCRLQQQQVGRGGEPHLPAALRRQVAKGDRQMGFPRARRPEQHHVLHPLDKRRAAPFLYLPARRAGGKTESVAVQRPDRWPPRGPGEHRARPAPAHFALTSQGFLAEVAERGIACRRGLGRCAIQVGHRRQPRLGANLDDLGVLGAVYATAAGAIPTGEANSAS